MKANSLSRRFGRPTLIATAAVAALWLGGCAIRPVPLTDAELKQTAQVERVAIFGEQAPLAGPVTLDEAMARAIRYNLDHRLKMMEQALGQRQLDLANFDLLPKLTAQAGYSNRNVPLASSSTSLLNPGQTTVPQSYSSDLDDRTADIGLAWNALDFGVSYYEAKQQSDRVLVLEQRRRKVVQLMMQQVREAYWQAAGAQRLNEHVGPLLEQARVALAESRKVQQERLRSPLETLNYQHAILDVMRQLEAVRDHLDEAKPRLASLMNLDPSVQFTLADTPALAAPTFAMSMDRMEAMALERRPELVEASYNQRISVNETHKALAKLLPGIEIHLGEHYDSNSFLAYNTWRAAGLSVSWNLLNVLNVKNIRGMADAQMQMAHTQQLALGMAVLTQVHVARTQFEAKQRQFDLFKQLDDVDAQILTHTHNAAEANAQGKLEEIRAATGAMIAELRMYESWGDLEGAYGQMLASLGLDPLPATLPADDLPALTQAIGREQQRWAQLGALGTLGTETAK